MASCQGPQGPSELCTSSPSPEAQDQDPQILTPGDVNLLTSKGPRRKLQSRRKRLQAGPRCRQTAGQRHWEETRGQGGLGPPATTHPRAGGARPATKGVSTLTGTPSPSLTASNCQALSALAGNPLQRTQQANPLRKRGTATLHRPHPHPRNARVPGPPFILQHMVRNSVQEAPATNPESWSSRASAPQMHTHKHLPGFEVRLRMSRPTLSEVCPSLHVQGSPAPSLGSLLQYRAVPGPKSAKPIPPHPALGGCEEQCIPLLPRAALMPQEP